MAKKNNNNSTATLPNAPDVGLTDAEINELRERL